MKKTMSITISLLVALFIIYWFYKSEFEFGKYDDFQEALKKGIPYKVNNIIHTEEQGGLTVVMYTTDPDKKAFPSANWDALAIAFFTGSDKDDWEGKGRHAWTHYENDNMTLYIEPFYDFDRQGNELHDSYVVFGEVHNPEIVKVETKGHYEESFEETEIIEVEGKRYYFRIGREPIVRGLSKTGEVIDRQGG
jgi:uncharacterized protein YxeA